MELDRFVDEEDDSIRRHEATARPRSRSGRGSGQSAGVGLIDGNHKIIFDQSERELAHQERSLDGLRTRAGTLLTASSIITAFLGAQALEAHQSVTRIAGEAVTRAEITSLGWVAVACFVAIVIITIILLLPRPWIFTHDTHELIDFFIEPDPRPASDDLYYHLAYWNHVNAAKNDERLDWMLWLFSAGCVLLAAEAILWLLVIVEE